MSRSSAARSGSDSVLAWTRQRLAVAPRQERDLQAREAAQVVRERVVDPEPDRHPCDRQRREHRDDHELVELPVAAAPSPAPAAGLRPGRCSSGKRETPRRSRRPSVSAITRWSSPTSIISVGVDALAVIREDRCDRSRRRRWRPLRGTRSRPSAAARPGPGVRRPARESGRTRARRRRFRRRPTCARRRRPTVLIST